MTKLSTIHIDEKLHTALKVDASARREKLRHYITVVINAGRIALKKQSREESSKKH